MVLTVHYFIFSIPLIKTSSLKNQNIEKEINGPMAKTTRLAACLCLVHAACTVASQALPRWAVARLRSTIYVATAVYQDQTFFFARVKAGQNLQSTRGGRQVVRVGRPQPHNLGSLLIYSSSFCVYIGSFNTPAYIPAWNFLPGRFNLQLSSACISPIPRRSTVCFLGAPSNFCSISSPVFMPLLFLHHPLDLIYHV